MASSEESSSKMVISLPCFVPQCSSDCSYFHVESHAPQPLPIVCASLRLVLVEPSHRFSRLLDFLQFLKALRDREYYEKGFL